MPVTVSTVHLKWEDFKGCFCRERKAHAVALGGSGEGGGGVKKLPYKNDEGARRVLRGFSTS